MEGTNLSLDTTLPELRILVFNACCFPAKSFFLRIALSANGAELKKKIEEKLKANFPVFIFIDARTVLLDHIKLKDLTYYIQYNTLSIKLVSTAQNIKMSWEGATMPPNEELEMKNKFVGETKVPKLIEFPDVENFEVIPPEPQYTMLQTNLYACKHHFSLILGISVMVINGRLSGEEATIINLSNDEGIPQATIKLLSNNKITTLRYSDVDPIIPKKGDKVLVLPIYKKGVLIKHGGTRGELLTTWDPSKSSITLRFENGNIGSINTVYSCVRCVDISAIKSDSEMPPNPYSDKSNIKTEQSTTMLRVGTVHNRDKVRYPEKTTVESSDYDFAQQQLENFKRRKMEDRIKQKDIEYKEHQIKEKINQYRRETEERTSIVADIKRQREREVSQRIELLKEDQDFELELARENLKQLLKERFVQNQNKSPTDSRERIAKRQKAISENIAILTRNKTESKKCKFCQEKNIDTLLLPCGHLNFCYDCVASNNRVFNCPECGVSVSERMKVAIVDNQWDLV